MEVFEDCSLTYSSRNLRVLSSGSDLRYNYNSASNETGKVKFQYQNYNNKLKKVPTDHPHLITCTQTKTDGKSTGRNSLSC